MGKGILEIEFELTKTNTIKTILLTYLIITILIESVNCNNEYYYHRQETIMEQQISEIIKDFGKKCAEILRQQNTEEEVRHKRLGFRNLPALRQRPEDVKLCTISLVGDDPNPNPELEKLCFAVRTCAQHFDTSSSSRPIFSKTSLWTWFTTIINSLMLISFSKLYVSLR